MIPLGSRKNIFEKKKEKRRRYSACEK